MPKKIKLAQVAIAATAGDDVVIGANDSLNPDVLDGGPGNDTLVGYQGADTMIGGEGADTFKVNSWADSNALYGVKTVQDFNLADGDVIDLANIKHYSAADMAVAVSRPVNFGDVTLSAEPGGGTHLHIEVVAGDSRWDIDMVILGDVPVEGSFVFG